VWFRWPAHADLYLTAVNARLIGKTLGDEESLGTGAGAAIGSLLERHSKLSEITVWLGGSMVRYGMLEAVQGKLSQNDLHQLVLSELQSQGAVPNWHVDIGPPDQTGSRLWAAAAKDLLLQIEAVANQYKVKVCGIAPVLSAVFWNGQPSRDVMPPSADQAEPKQVVVVREVDGLTALEWNAAGIISVRQMTTGIDVDALSQTLERLQIQCGVPTDEMQWVDLAEHELDALQLGMRAESLLMTPMWLARAQT
jgi:hypothetical protein